MKKVFLLPLLALLLTSAAHAQAYTRTCSEEHFLSSAPQANPLRAVAYATQDTIFSVGDNGNIIQSNDGGNSWFLQPHMTYYALYDVVFPQKDTGYIGGQSSNYGCVLKTVDRGQTWTPLFYGTLTYSNIYSLWFTNTQTGYAGGGGKVYKTTNGGTSWTSANVSSGSVSDLFFVNADTGFAANVNRIYRTTNAGTSWSQQYYNASENIVSLSFTSHDTGYFGTLSGKIFKTTNGGAAWTQITTVSSAARQIQFTDSQTGYISTSNGYVYKTIDAGATWTWTSVLSSTDLLGLGFSGQRGVVVSKYGDIEVTNNSGGTYTNKKSVLPLSFYSLDMINHNVGYFGGTGAKVYKTTNGGQTFTSQTTGGYDQYIMRMNFPNQDTGYINGWKIITSGNNPILKRTFNGGATWSNVPAYNSTIFGQFSDIFFVTGKFGFMTQGRNILRTVDAGTSWTIIPAGDTNRFASIFFLNKDTGWACGNNGKTVRSVDGGVTWTQFTIPTTDDFMTISFKNGQEGYVGSSNGTMYKTTDGGQTWTLYINYGTAYQVLDIQWADQQTGFYRVWDNWFGAIYKTIDGGQSWRQYDYEYFNYNFTGMEYSDPDTLYVIGYNGIIFQLYDKYPQPPVVSYNVCDSGSVAVTVPTSYSNINFYSTSSYAYPLHSGTPYNTGMIYQSDTLYYAISDSMLGCDSRRSEIFLNVLPTPSPQTISFTGDTICQGNSVTLSVPCNFSSYLWSNGATTCSINVSASGDYSVSVSNGTCSNSSDTATVTVIPLPNTPAISFALPDSLVSSVTGASYHWLFNGVPIPDSTQAIAIPGQPGYYMVVVENSSGCFSDTSAAFIITGGEFYAAASISTWPNPAGNELHVASLQKIRTLEIVDAPGKVVMRFEGNIPAAIDITSLPNGIYLVKCKLDDGSVAVKKIEVQH